MISDVSPAESASAGGNGDLLVPLRRGGAKPPLFCLHAVSGSAYAYAGLAGLLPPDQPVYGFEAPGFDNDRTPTASLPGLADEYTMALRAFAPAREYRLLGWSLGGLLAFEIAKRLSAAGDVVSALILVDAPLPRVMPLPPEREILLRFINDMMGTSEDEAPPHARVVVDGWADDVDPAAVFPLIERAGILPAEMDAVVLADQYAVFRALLEGFHSIDVNGRYDGRALHILAEVSPPHQMDWSKALPGIREVTLPGTHYSIWSGQSLVMMSNIVRDELGIH